METRMITTNDQYNRDKIEKIPSLIIDLNEGGITHGKAIRIDTRNNTTCVRIVIGILMIYTIIRVKWRE